jgi:hypothetical protein
VPSYEAERIRGVGIGVTLTSQTVRTDRRNDAASGGVPLLRAHALLERRTRVDVTREVVDQAQPNQRMMWHGRQG